MKVYLDAKKYFDFTLDNWNKVQSDFELEELRNLFVEFVCVIGELPIYDPNTGKYNMVSVLENEYVFNQTVRFFCLHLNLPLELPVYMSKTKSEPVKIELPKNIKIKKKK